VRHLPTEATTYPAQRETGAATVTIEKIGDTWVTTRAELLAAIRGVPTEASA